MFDFCRGNLLIIVATVLIGCADNSDRMDLRVGFFFAEDTQRLTMRFEPNHYPVFDAKDDLRVGKDIISRFTEAARQVFNSVEILGSYPTKESIADRKLNLVVVVQARPGGGFLGYEGDSIQNSSEARRSLTAELTCFNLEMMKVTAIRASGEGNATAKGILFDSKRKAFVNSVKAAIRNLEDDVVLQMSTNPEIRKMAE